MFIRSGIVLVLAVFVVACGGSSSPIAPSANVPYSQTDLRVGSGAEATGGRVVTVHYTGWLYDANATGNRGTQFDSSIGRTPFVFALGSGSVIRGWDQGVAGMRVGGQRRLIIPPDLAYGSRGSSGVIPPNATLIFEIELLGVQ